MAVEELASQQTVLELLACGLEAQQDESLMQQLELATARGA